jgi:hypothetical protein
MMQAADLRESDDVMACGGELYTARPWTILVERKMRSGFMVVLKIARQDAA